MEQRPRIQLTLSPIDNLLELTGKLLLVFMWGLIVYAFLKLPEIIPTHFNASGQVDGHGNKITLLVLPVIASILYFGMTQLNKYPHIFNYLVEITENNAERQYTIATRLLRFLKTAIVFLFTLIVIFTCLVSTGIARGLGIWFLPFIFILIFTPIIMAISKSFKKK